MSFEEEKRIISIAKSDFVEKHKYENQNVGIRRQTYYQKVWDQTAHDILKEREEQPPVEDYCTTYDSQMGKPEFKHKEITLEKTDVSVFNHFPRK